MAHDVFISYASKDKVVADAVCAALEADHIRCYIAPRDVLPGQRYAQALVDAIHNAKVFVLVFSAASNASNQVEREVDRAVSCGLPILPLRVEDVMPCDWLEYYLAGQHWLDALSPPLEDHLARLSVAIGVLLQLPARGGRSPSRDEWRGDTGAVTQPAPGGRAADERAPSAPPSEPVADKPAATPPAPIERPPVVTRPMEYVPPRAAVQPSEAARPAEVVKPVIAPQPEALKPAVTPPSKPVKPPEIAPPSKAVKPPETTAQSAPAGAKPAPAAAKPTTAVVKPAPTAALTVAARAPAASPKAATAAAPARKGRRTALIAAAVVGASWIGVLLAVELLFR